MPYKVNEDVLYRAQGTQGRAVADPPMIYTIVQCIPIEADGRLRYRIKSKSGNIERVVTEDQLLYAQYLARVVPLGDKAPSLLHD